MYNINPQRYEFSEGLRGWGTAGGTELKAGPGYLWGAVKCSTVNDHREGNNVHRMGQPSTAPCYATILVENLLRILINLAKELSLREFLY